LKNAEVIIFLEITRKTKQNAYNENGKEKLEIETAYYAFNGE